MQPQLRFTDFAAWLRSQDPDRVVNGPPSLCCPVAEWLTATTGHKARANAREWSFYYAKLDSYPMPQVFSVFIRKFDNRRLDNPHWTWTMGDAIAALNTMEVPICPMLPK